MKRLNDLVGKITIEGKEVTLRDCMTDLSGSGYIYDENNEQIIDAALTTDVFWGDVQDYLCPIVDEILIEAAEEDQEVYLELITAIKTAYVKLKHKHEQTRAAEEEEANKDQEYILNSETIDLFAHIENMLHHLNKGWAIKEFELKAFGDYRVVVGATGQ